MGVPRFFRAISERYPGVVVDFDPEKPYYVDYIYLDANYLIHDFTHANKPEPTPCDKIDSKLDKMFEYLDSIFKVLQPKKSIFFAVDSTPPRAKISQQRIRRFVSVYSNSKAVNEQLDRDSNPNEKIEYFDPNIISPGTKFMDDLEVKFLEYIRKKMPTFDSNEELNIYFSGHCTPGEGEHKIFEFVRFIKSQSDYDPSSVHVLMTPDADVMNLGMLAECENFFILRNIGNDKSNLYKMIFIQIPMLKDYLISDLELRVNEDTKLNPNIITTDLVFIFIFVGNDFLPNLPNFHIHSNALSDLINCYVDSLPLFDGPSLIEDNGQINLKNLRIFLEKLQVLEDQIILESIEENLKFVTNDDYSSESGSLNLENFNESYPMLNDLKFNVNADSFVEQNKNIQSNISYSNIFLDFITNEYNSDSSPETIVKGFKNQYWSKKFKDQRSNISERVSKSYLEGLQWNILYYKGIKCSWTYSYDYHYSPFISDLIENLTESYNKLHIDPVPCSLEHQLLAILPEKSMKLMHPPLNTVFENKDLKLSKYLNKEIEFDSNGKLALWEAVSNVDFLDWNDVEEAIKYLESNKSLKFKNLKPIHMFSTGINEFSLHNTFLSENEQKFLEETLDCNYFNISVTNSINETIYCNYITDKYTPLITEKLMHHGQEFSALSDVIILEKKKLYLNNIISLVSKGKVPIVKFNRHFSDFGIVNQIMDSKKIAVVGSNQEIVLFSQVNSQKNLSRYVKNKLSRTGIKYSHADLVIIYHKAAYITDDNHILFSLQLSVDPHETMSGFNSKIDTNRLKNVDCCPQLYIELTDGNTAGKILRNINEQYVIPDFGLESILFEFYKHYDECISIQCLKKIHFVNDFILNLLTSKIEVTDSSNNKNKQSIGFDLKSVEIPFSCKCLPNSQILVSYTFLNFLMKWVATNTQTLNNIQDIISEKKNFNLEILTSFQNIINKSLNIFKKTSKSSYITKKLESKSWEVKNLLDVDKFEQRESLNTAIPIYSQYNLSFCKEILTHNQHFNEFDVVVILSDGYGLQFGSFAIVIRAHLIDIPLIGNKSRMSNLKVLQHSLDLYSIDNREVVKNYPSKAALICKKYIKPRISVDDLVSQLSNSKQSQSALFKKKESHNASQNKSQIQSNRNSTKNQYNQKNKKSIEIKPEANNQTILAQSKSSVDMQKQSVKTKKAINLDTNTVKYKQIHIKDLFSNINVSDKPKTPQRSKSYIKLSDK